MSSHNLPVDGSVVHSGDTLPAGHNGTETRAQTSAAPPADVVATPIYDELAARFDLPNGREGAERSADPAPVGTTPSGAVEVDEESIAVRPAC
ncbi:hypothetical protein ACRAKI_20120 [Saccharothrix isguenensis]